jgi:imidazoleglycerol-phosphate dehydratase
MNRKSTVKRETLETNISVKLNLDNQETSSIITPIPFLNHMLTAFSFYAGWSLDIDASGDVEVDDHHLVEDIGIVLGQAFNEALKNRKGIVRFASNYTPMDESLARCVLDISSRSTLVYRVSFKRDVIGGLSLENIQEFLKAFVNQSKITLHIDVMYGQNDHHKVEAIFKSLGRAINDAIQVKSNQVTSTKGVL